MNTGTQHLLTFVLLKKKKELDLIDTSNSKDSKKKIPLGIKVLFGILGVPIAFFIIVFLIFFIKGFIQEIS